MGKVLVFDHPLIQHKVTLMRKTETNNKEFRELAKEVVTLMGYEATRNLPLMDVEIETPICKTTQKMLYPNAKVGHVGLYRDPETHMPVEYYCKLPRDIDKRTIFVVDPMLATGGSAIDAINSIKARGGKDIIFMCLIAAPEGIEALQKAHPDVDIYIAQQDEKLDEHAYIVPGLGDAGDRLF